MMQTVALTEPQPICNIQIRCLKCQETGTFPPLPCVEVSLYVWTHDENNYKANENMLLKPPFAVLSGMKSMQQ